MIKPDEVIQALEWALLAWDETPESWFKNERDDALGLLRQYREQDDLEPDDLFTEAELFTWAYDNGLTEAEDEDE